MAKLTIVGGGSAYTPDILQSLLAEPQLFAGWEWVLHDVNQEAARIVAALGRALVRAAGAEIRVRHTTDRAEAVAGARFVLAQPRPGGLQARSLDEKIPLRHGVLGQETLGAGGFAFAWRSIPVVLDLVAEMRRLAPEAWLISYTNPAGMVTEAVTRVYPDARFIGLCDMPTGVQWELARVLRVDPHRLELEYRGINHAGWIESVRLDGKEDLLPRVRRLARWLPVGWLPVGEVTGTLRLIQQHGRIPDPYLRYYYFRDAIVARLRRRRRTRADEVMTTVRRLYDHFAAEARSERPRLRLHRGHASHSDLAAAVIRAMVAGRRERFIIQQRNPGHLGGLPPGRAAQFPALVGPEGWEPLPVTPLPEPEAALIRQIQEAEALNVTATLEGDRAKAVEAMALNPLVGSRPLAERLVEELLAAHRPYLPTFFR
ncbi:MAG: hypothetical protein L6E13_01920 [Firmicutes bacterium]|nr:hypothetical protein [Bacillota bacterium]